MSEQKGPGIHGPCMDGMKKMVSAPCSYMSGKQGLVGISYRWVLVLSTRVVDHLGKEGASHHSVSSAVSRQLHEKIYEKVLPNIRS